MNWFYQFIPLISQNNYIKRLSNDYTEKKIIHIYDMLIDNAFC